MRNAYNGRYEANARSRARICARGHTDNKHVQARTRACVCTEYACPGGDVSAQTELGDNGYQRWLYIDGRVLGS